MTQEDLNCNLAAIISLDAKGYNRLVDYDEEATFGLWLPAMTDFIQQYRGRLVNTPDIKIFVDMNIASKK